MYFLLTLIYTLLIPLILQMFSVASALADLPLPAVAVFMLTPCFLSMLLYGYVIAKTKRPKKPKSMLVMYLPVVMPLIWYLFIMGIANILEIYGDFAAIIVSFVTLNLFGAAAANRFSGFEYWHYTLLLNLLYYLVILLGFAVGERLADRKINAGRKPFRYHAMLIVSLAIVVFCAYAFSEYSLYRNRINIVTSAEPYGFNYAGGYSSIDLRPYYVENEENILAKLEVPSTFVISDAKEMPILDGAEAAYPVYSAFANACYEDIAEIQETAKESKSDSVMPVQFTNTIYAYEKLLTKEIDIFFGAKPSKEQLQMAKDAGVELKLTPIGKEAFVFFVSDENPVDELSSEQIRDIYSGEINNWRKVGGKNQQILPFQRPENSGSQTMMEYFMGDIPLREPLEAEFEFGMSGLVRAVADYENSASSLGYSFRYYTTIMMAETDSEEAVAGIKLLAVDGVYPDTETIRSGEYPYTTELYAITIANRTIKKNSKDTIEPFLAWMTGPQGQQIVADTGYVALQ